MQSLFSGFDNSAILTLDAFGEKQSGGFYIKKKNEINKLDSFYFPHSLGSFYSTFTEICGFQPQSDEWKLMGASAYGIKSNNIFYKKIRNLVDLYKNGKFELNLKYFINFIFHRPYFSTKNYLHISILKK